jgi:hypothetical protein
MLDIEGGYNMRYRIISRETDNTRDWVNLTIAGFRNAADACRVCQRIDISAYVVDTLTDTTLYSK